MTRARAAGSALVCLAMAAALVAGTGPSTAGDADRRDRDDRSADRELRPWSGFRIERTGQASGSWIGAQRLGRRGPVLYRIDPAAAAGATTYEPGRWVSKVRGNGSRFAAERRATARASWILSKYGTFRYDTQSAAVDAAVLHLLAGHRWTLSGDHGARRIRQTGQGAEVRRFARIMLDDSLTRSGPYAVEVRQQDEAVVGDSVRLSIRVTVARNGRPLPLVPVRVITPAGAARVGPTDDNGRVGLTYSSPPAGATPIRVVVGQVPETRLRLLAPRRAATSRVVVAGRKRQLTGAGAVYVKARPRVVVAATDTRVPAGGQNKGRFRLSGSAEAWPRRTVVTLHGPFASPDKVRCGARTTRKAHVRVTGAGSYALPRYTLRKEAIYVWRVRVPGNAVNLPAEDCGGRFRVVRR